MPVRMRRTTLEKIPAHSVPEGFRFTPVTAATIPEWTEIQRAAEPFNPTPDHLFREVFGADDHEISERCFVLRDAEGRGVGTISAWYHDNFQGESWGRVHWVAIRPELQRRGLAKAMLAHCLNALGKWHRNAYLVTSENRLPAIALYLKFGFEPMILEPVDRSIWERILGRLAD